MDSNIRDLIEQGDRLFDKRGTLMSRWQEIADYMYPERADFTASKSSGDHFADNLVTSYPLLARRELGDTFSTMLRPQETPWFSLEYEDADHEGKAWLEWATGQQRRAMYDRRSQFVRATKEGDHDFAAFGQCVISVELLPDRTGFLYRCWHLRDVVWCEGPDGAIESVHRKWTPDAHTLERMFPGRLHSQVTEKMRKDRYCDVHVRHIVVPTDVYGDKSIKAPYVSLYVDCDHEHVMERAPVRVQPYVIPRWQTVSGSQYAYSPATICALPDTRLIQAMTLSLLEAGEKAANPPMVATMDAVRSEINLFPGGVTWVDSAYDERMGEPLRELRRDRSGMPLSLEMLQDVREMIRKAFYLDKLELPVRAPEMTAFEVAQRVQQYVRQALPLFEPMESNYNGALCETTFSVGWNAGLFGPPDSVPRSLLGAQTEFKFTSPLREAIDEQKADTFMRAGGVIERAAMVDPAIAQLVDYETTVRDVLDGMRVPAEWLRSEDQFAAIREQVAAAAAQQQRMAMLQQGSEVAKNVGVTA